MAEKNIEFNNSDASHLPKQDDEQQQVQMPNFDGENDLNSDDGLLLVPQDNLNDVDIYIGEDGNSVGGLPLDSIFKSAEVLPDISNDVKEPQMNRILSMENLLLLNDGKEEEKEKQIEEEETGGDLKEFPKAKKKRRSNRKGNRAAWTGLLCFKRQCRHCHTEETSQWRKGPEGPKTLCNACGVCYTRGKLLPEYRPAASPTFDKNIHSNYHWQVLKRKASMAYLEE